MTLTLYDEFAGWGGSSQGCTAVPGVELILAANHDKLAIEVHEMNFPGAEHYPGDIVKARIEQFPRADLFWASPVCHPWTNAQGKRRDFDRTTETLPLGGEWEEKTEKEKRAEKETRRSRALMEEVPRYLGAMRLRGKPVLAGVVENVIECRQWSEFGRWISEIRSHGYKTRLIALNSMHAHSRHTFRAPQSRDRMYVAYWLDTIRTPDWDKWLRPRSWCPGCDQWVNAVQVFKQPGTDMGRYGIRNGQYVYRCPRTSCRSHVLEPGYLPATAAIDWSLPPGQRIGDRGKPLKPATLARIQAGLDRFAPPFLAPAGFSANGFHHGLVNGDTEHLLVPYYRTGVARTLDEPMGTLTTRDRHGLLGYTRPVRIEDCTFRMFEPEEIARGMAFRDGYKDKGDKRARARGYGNAVTPPAAEVTFSALVEAITGEDLEPSA